MCLPIVKRYRLRNKWIYFTEIALQTAFWAYSKL